MKLTFMIVTAPMGLLELRLIYDFAGTELDIYDHPICYLYTVWQLLSTSIIN